MVVEKIYRQVVFFALLPLFSYLILYIKIQIFEFLYDLKLFGLDLSKNSENRKFIKLL